MEKQVREKYRIALDIASPEIRDPVNVVESGHQEDINFSSQFSINFSNFLLYSLSCVLQLVDKDLVLGHGRLVGAPDQVDQIFLDTDHFHALLCEVLGSVSVTSNRNLSRVEPNLRSLRQIGGHPFEISWFSKLHLPH